MSIYSYSSRLTMSFSALFLFIAISVSGYATAAPADQLRQLLQLAEYVGVDYSAAVSEGEIADPAEYQEMVEFSALILEKSQRLLEDKPEIIGLAKSLQTAVTDKRDIAVIQSLSSQLRSKMLALSPQLSLPRALAAKATTQQFFENNCASCHGLTGKGDGILAQQLEPTPTDFTDKERALNRSLLGLYDAISEGIEGTAMPSFKQLSEQQRWSLAFYAGSLAFTASDNAANNKPALALQDLVLYSPADLNRQDDAGLWLELEQARGNPAVLFQQKQSPLAIARQRLNEAVLAHHQGEYDKATHLAVSAYLDGFELLENNLDARDKVLRRSIELKLLALRQQLNSQHTIQQVDQAIETVLLELQQAEALLTEHAMSNSALFSASFLILLREGLEALLVIIALSTLLLRAQKKEALRYLHIGWVTALVAGGVTWWVAQYLITISGASREIMEGVAALIAAIVLFYVGFWMHSKTNAEQWQSYIQKNIDRNLKAGTLWGISGLAFITVYREVFETVLFYQSLLTQAAASQQVHLISGFGLAVLVLFVIAWAMVKYSVKLPIAKFFSTTTYLLLALSFVLAGKAITALQEAAIITISPLPFTLHIEWLGINSTWQGMLVQLSILLLSILLLTKRWLKAKWQASHITVRKP
ncbi:cytochrome c/FTR1 family iron permease [Dasania marina]|uniref:cytochrome c/FTR1 family iron permease n=1 Tax=Dasania marina TaxID=471499 RepID=UPI0003682471|nr:cytochrome c/FTR1 family iron permease [Dasania marina]